MQVCLLFSGRLSLGKSTSACQLLFLYLSSLQVTMTTSADLAGSSSIVSMMAENEKKTIIVID